MKEIVASQEELDSVVAYLDNILPKDTILFLRGDLAAGKTTLAQAIVKTKGNRGLTSNDLQSESFAGLTPATIVTSPTFSLQHCYGDGLYHYDLYRIDHDEFMRLGLFEEFDREGWHMVEWGSDRLKELLESVGYGVAVVEIEQLEQKRKYTIKNANA